MCETSKHSIRWISSSLPIFDVWIWDFNKNRSDLAVSGVRVRGSFHFRRINWQFITRKERNDGVKNCSLISEKSSFNIQIWIALVGVVAGLQGGLYEIRHYITVSCLVCHLANPAAAANFHSSMTFESLFFLCHNLFYLQNTRLCVFRSLLSTDLSTIGTWKAFWMVF